MCCQAALLYLVWGTSGARGLELERVRQHTQRARAIASEQGFPFCELIALLLDASARVASGDERAVSDLLQGVQLRRQAGATHGECWQACFISLAQRLQGKVTDAIETLEAALAYCERDDARFFQAEVHRNLAETWLDPTNPRRDVQQGLSELERAERVAQKYGTGWWSLAIAVSRLRCTRAGSDVRRLETLLGPMPESPSEPPLVREARQLLEEARRADAAGSALNP